MPRRGASAVAQGIRQGVSVRSAYHDHDGTLRGRQFTFSIDRDVEHDKDPEGFAHSGTAVRLDGFKDAFQQSAPKGVDAIAREIFEHCIWYFLRPGGAPEVTIADDHESVSLSDLLHEFVYSEMPRSTVEVKGQKFDMNNLCLKSSTRNAVPHLYWCAASRVVNEENLTGKVPGLYGRLRDEASGEFTYACYLTSEFLDGHVHADRTAFDIPERIAGESLADDITLDDIRAAVLAEVEKILANPLAVARDEGKERVHDFVSRRAPRYRPVLARLEPLGITVDPTFRDQELELLLHRQLQKLEADSLAQGAGDLRRCRH